MENIVVPISVGELMDKISILEIKQDRIAESHKLENINRELAYLLDIREERVPFTVEVDELYGRLKETNENLWEIEDKIRKCERSQDFGEEFIQLARFVYHENDKRAQIKSDLNNKLGSALREEKSYSNY
ncbi:DUF6165 family protein [Peredibacter starrii]|uniref:DUF6165 family protein n=1 Tax=Peredibacter starrii TaxID=28202 RepID=A0AAX4HIS2_9BACT|nr:DUF6165 family protein [Peredibacter starrii]WPU63137.1 DUF6165 family protein [Peredibacter starrii]